VFETVLLQNLELIIIHCVLEHDVRIAPGHSASAIGCTFSRSWRYLFTQLLTISATQGHCLPLGAAVGSIYIICRRTLYHIEKTFSDKYTPTTPTHRLNIIL